MKEMSSQTIVTEHLPKAGVVAEAGVTEVEAIQMEATLFQQQVNLLLIEGVSFVKTHHTLLMFVQAGACDYYTCIFFVCYIAILILELIAYCWLFDTNNTDLLLWPQGCFVWYKFRARKSYIINYVSAK